MSKPHIGIIISTTREGRFGERAARWVSQLAAGRSDITTEIVDEEIQRLQAAWRAREGVDDSGELLETMLSRDQLSQIDEFDRLQLREVVRVCRSCPSLSEAGRRLFGVSRTRKAAPNDADRLRKYLARFGLEWKTIKAETQSPV